MLVLTNCIIKMTYCCETIMDIRCYSNTTKYDTDIAYFIYTNSNTNTHTGYTYTITIYVIPYALSLLATPWCIPIPWRLVLDEELLAIWEPRLLPKSPAPDARLILIQTC